MQLPAHRKIAELARKEAERIACQDLGNRKRIQDVVQKR
jgi:hypothetical protein